MREHNGGKKCRAGWWRRARFVEVGAPLCIVALTLLLGMCGRWLGHASNEGGASLASKWWETVGYFKGETNFNPIGEQGLAAALVVAARVLGLSFLGWTALMLLWKQVGNRIKASLVGCWRRPPVLVLGAGRKGMRLALKLLALGERVVVVERDEALAGLESLREPGAIVFIGDARSESVLRQAGILKAKEVYILCGSDESNYGQALQIELLFGGLRGPMKPNADKGDHANPVASGLDEVVVHVRLESLEYRMFMDQRPGDRLIASHCFGFNELSARLLARTPEWIPVWRAGEEHMRNLHTVVFGFNAQAKAIVVQHLQMLHLRDGQSRVISIVCRNAEQMKGEFLEEYPCLQLAETLEHEMRRVCDGLFPVLEFVEMPRDIGEMRLASFRPFRNIAAGWRLNVVYCLDSSLKSRGLQQALEGFLEWRMAHLGGHFEYKCACVGIEFGNPETLCTPESIKDPEADFAAKEIMMFYERQYAGRDAHTGPDYARVRDRLWAREKNEWERESCRQAADHIDVKLAVIGVNRGDADGYVERLGLPGVMELMARLEHRRWSAERLLQGWRPLPEAERKNWEGDIRRIKDKLKWHIDLVPFDELTQPEQEKDYGMIREIQNIMRSSESLEISKTGSKVCRDTNIYHLTPSVQHFR